jgi:hypothetical protein
MQVDALLDRERECAPVRDDKATFDIRVSAHSSAIINDNQQMQLNRFIY